MKRRILSGLLAAVCLLLAGCGSIFDREYLSISDYEPPMQEKETDEGGIMVKTVDELNQVLSVLIDEQAEEGRIAFDAEYQGDINADMASTCWEVRTRNALYAYCVESISYDVSKIVSHYEAKVTIRYTAAGRDLDSIVRLQLMSGLEDEIHAAIAEGTGRLVVLIARSSYTAEDVESLAGKVYREHPVLAPKEPRVTVNMLSGTGMQRLYEISFNYGMTAEELTARRNAMNNLRPFTRKELRSEDLPRNALTACNYLLEHAVFSETGSNDIYSALVTGEADSEGLALAYVELCSRLNVPCQIVYGQRDWRNHCWNIIQLDGRYYHVDITVCATEGMEQGFLLPDETMWAHYRWDISSYPPCSGPLRYADLFSAPV